MATNGALENLRLGWISAQIATADLRYKQAQLFKLCPRRMTCELAHAAQSTQGSRRCAPCVDCGVLNDTKEWYAICAAN